MGTHALSLACQRAFFSNKTFGVNSSAILNSYITNGLSKDQNSITVKKYALDNPLQFTLLGGGKSN